MLKESITVIIIVVVVTRIIRGGQPLKKGRPTLSPFSWSRSASATTISLVIRSPTHFSADDQFTKAWFFAGCNKRHYTILLSVYNTTPWQRQNAQYICD